jgi:hypothetical protein
MKIVTYILIGLLVVTLCGGAYFYLYMHKPMAGEYEKMKQGQPEFEKARKELSKFKAKEQQETGWTGPAVEALKKGLANEISTGKAEIVAAGNRVVVNIDEGVLYTPQSVTFAKSSQQSLANLAALLKELKDKEIFVGNMTHPTPAQGKGRKRVPAKDARTLAAGRSMELVKYLEKNGVAAETLIAAAYPGTTPERGFKINEKKTVIVITAPAAAAPEAPRQETKAAPATKITTTAAAAAPKQETKPAPAAKSTPTVTAGSPAPQPKSIPISTVPPKKVP